MKIKPIVWIALIFIVVFAIRLYFAFQTDTVSYDSYFALRQIEHIDKTGLPLYNDPLSYEGRIFIFPPLFYYLASFLGVFLSSIVAAKIIANLLAASLVIIIYLIVNKIVQNEKIALVVGLFAGFLPVLMNTIYDVNPLMLSLALFFLILYFFMDLTPDHITIILVLMLLLVLTSPVALLLVVAFVLYLLFSRVEGFTPNKKEIELSFFFTFLAFWASLIIYKKALFVHGLGIFNYNIPQVLAANIFLNITFLEAFVFIGIIPLALGIYGAFIALSKNKSKPAMLIMSVVITFFIALFLKIIPLEMGLLFMGLSLTILMAISLSEIYMVFIKSKIAKYSFFAIALFFILFALLGIFPSILLAMDKEKLPQQTDIEALKWIENNTQQKDVILGQANEGQLIAYIAQRKNMMDSNYLAIPLINQRYQDLSILYTTPFQTDALPLLHYYNIKYIFISQRTQDMLNTTNVRYIEKNCFRRAYNQTDLIYEVKC
jgi:hypothetical protein